MKHKTNANKITTTEINGKRNIYIQKLQQTSSISVIKENDTIIISKNIISKNTQNLRMCIAKTKDIFF